MAKNFFDSLGRVTQTSLISAALYLIVLFFQQVPELLTIGSFLIAAFLVGAVADGMKLRKFPQFFMIGFITLFGYNFVISGFEFNFLYVLAGAELGLITALVAWIRGQIK